MSETREWDFSPTIHPPRPHLTSEDWTRASYDRLNKNKEFIRFMYQNAVSYNMEKSSNKDNFPPEAYYAIKTNPKNNTKATFRLHRMSHQFLHDILQVVAELGKCKGWSK